MTALRAVRRTALVLAVLAMVAAAAPVRAAGDEDFKGWFLTLDAALTQPNGLEQQYAFASTGFGTINDQRLIFDNDSDFTGAIKFGYGFGNGLGRLQVSFWGFDNEDTVDSTLSASVVPTVFGYGYYSMYLSSYYGPVEIQAKSKVQAATFDVDYLRSYAVGKKTTVTWLAGLRSATYEESQDFLGTWTYYPVYLYQQHKDFQADALGLRLGAAVNFGFTDHFGLEGSTTFSFLQAETEGDSFQAFPNGDVESLTGDDDNVRGEMREFDLKACWSYGMMDYFVGYRMETWDGLVIDPVLATGFTSSLQSRDSVSFNSLHAGVTFKFGKH